MSILKSITIAQKVKSIAAGIADSLPIIGPIKANIDSQNPEPGKIDYTRLIVSAGSSIALLYAMYLYGKGQLSFEELEALIKALF